VGLLFTCQHQRLIFKRWLFEYVTKELFQKHNLDCLATPTLPMVAPKMPTNADALLTGESNVPLVIEMMKYIFLANFLGLPAITLPVPPSPPSSSLSPEVSSDDEKDTKLPIGFQLTGDHWSEAKLIRIASTLEGSFKAKKDGSKGSLGKAELASSTCNTSDDDAPRPPDYFDALKS
jgi:Asp-tRNA(Asn)/Glu-tRNA(Gln) amidotransferase A subunit family amidase